MSQWLWFGWLWLYYCYYPGRDYRFDTIIVALIHNYWSFDCLSLWLWQFVILTWHLVIVTDKRISTSGAYHSNFDPLSFWLDTLSFVTWCFVILTWHCNSDWQGDQYQWCLSQWLWHFVILTGHFVIVTDKQISTSGAYHCDCHVPVRLYDSNTLQCFVGSNPQDQHKAPLTAVSWLSFFHSFHFLFGWLVGVSYILFRFIFTFLI